MRRGFTLIEVLAAMAILAVVSIMGVQALGGAVFQRDVLTRHDTDAAALARTLTLLRHDLAAIVRLADPAAQGETAFGIRERAGGREASWPILSLGPDARPVIRGVMWRVQDGRLERRLRPSALAIDALDPFEPLLPGVRGLTITAFGPGTQDPDALAPGYEAVIATERWGDLRLVVAR